MVIRAAGAHPRRPGQVSASERDPGSITTNAGVTPGVEQLSFSQLMSVAMGPRFRGDDSETDRNKNGRDCSRPFLFDECLGLNAAARHQAVAAATMPFRR